MGNFALLTGFLNTGAGVASKSPTVGSNVQPLNKAAGIAGLTSTGASFAVAAAGGTASAAASGGVLAALTAVGPLAAIAVPVFILLAKIFHGADPRQVPASQIEQIFEAGSGNLREAAAVGVLHPKTAAEGMRFFKQKGLEYYASQAPGLGKAGEKGSVNMVRVVDAQIAFVLTFKDRGQSLDLAKARARYMKQGAWGLQWYVPSLQAAGELADQLISGIPRDVKASTPVGGIQAASLLGDGKNPLTLSAFALGSFFLVGLLRRIVL